MPTETSTPPSTVRAPGSDVQAGTVNNERQAAAKNLILLANFIASILMHDTCHLTFHALRNHYVEQKSQIATNLSHLCRESGGDFSVVYPGVQIFCTPLSSSFPTKSIRVRDVAAFVRITLR